MAAAKWQVDACARDGRQPVLNGLELTRRQGDCSKTMTGELWPIPAQPHQPKTGARALFCGWPQLERRLQIGSARLVDSHEPVGDLTGRHKDCVGAAHQHIQGFLQVVEPMRYAGDVRV